MMTLDDIEPDTIIILTEELQRLFRFAECDPACHACEKHIDIGENFQLATHTPKTYRGELEGDGESRDVMLCSTCTVVDLANKERLARRKFQEWARQRRGYSRPSRVQ